MIRSLQSRLLLTVGALALLAVAAVALVARQGTRQDLRRFEEIEQRVAASKDMTAASAVRTVLEGRCCEPVVLAEAARALDPRQALLVIGTGRGDLVASTGAPLASATRITTSRDGRGLVVDVTFEREGRREQLILRFGDDGTPLRLSGGAGARLYVVPFPDPARGVHVAAMLHSMDLRLLWATAIIGMLALATTFVIARSSVGPLLALRAATRELALGRLGTRVQPKGSSEIVELGRDFNRMADDLERQHALRQQLLHDVAHELRTPLTALQCRLESVIDGLARDPAQAVKDLHDDVQHLSSLVNDLQDVALAEARMLTLDRRDHDAEELVRAAVRAAGLESDERLRVEIPQPVVVCGDRRRLLQVLSNLLSNADRHAPSGATISIAARTAAPGAVLTVTNTGSHLSSEERAHVFDRFYRTDPARQRSTGGSGLGLAIVKHLVEAHGGTVAVESDNDTVAFHVSLPGHTK